MYDDGGADTNLLATARQVLLSDEMIRQLNDGAPNEYTAALVSLVHANVKAGYVLYQVQQNFGDDMTMPILRSADLLAGIELDVKGVGRARVLLNGATINTMRLTNGKK
jgi:hypothetical protein